MIKVTAEGGVVLVLAELSLSGPNAGQCGRAAVCNGGSRCGVVHPHRCRVVQNWGEDALEAEPGDGGRRGARIGYVPPTRAHGSRAVGWRFEQAVYCAGFKQASMSSLRRR